jgi:UDP-3-O-[3-hydroxymyristoyl] glucosamine N-acyltransferase
VAGAVVGTGTVVGHGVVVGQGVVVGLGVVVGGGDVVGTKQQPASLHIFPVVPLHTIFAGFGLMTIGFGQTCETQVSGVVVGHGVVVGQGVVVGGRGVVVITKQQEITEHPYAELQATFSGFATVTYPAGQ